VDAEILTGADGTTLEFADEHAVSRSHLDAGTLGSVASGAVIGNGVKIFLDTVRSLTGLHQRFCLCYTNLSVGAFLAPVASAGYDLWLAAPGTRFPASVWPWSHATTRLWQWGFGTGHGGGDSDAFMGDDAQFLAYFNTAPPPPPPPPPAHAHLASMTGDDEVFYLPSGDNATVMVGIPEFVPGSSGVKPTALNFSCPSPVTLQWLKGGVAQALLVDANRSPQALPLADLAPGQRAIHIMRAGNASENATLITCHWT
jgi:hypothetical protein